MDDIVRQAMAKWPNVPDVYGWLSLSRRGEWRIKGEKISNPTVSDFISRNYTHDEQGRWFFQNGPQRVFVQLDYTPMVYRLADTSAIESHTGIPVSRISGAYIDDGGSLLLDTEAGVGVVDDRDLGHFLNLIVDISGQPITDGDLENLTSLEPKYWPNLQLRLPGEYVAMEAIPASEAPQRFTFNPRPHQPAGEEECY
ncbi:MAG: DUF2946 family protein [Burkholderiales bacterium]